jgi:hypothetical protein
MHPRIPVAVLLMFTAIALGALALPRATVACSCLVQSIEGVHGNAEFAVFTGIVDAPDARGYPVRVTRWFQGGGLIEPRVWLHPGSFGDGGGDCTVPGPTIGTEWIFLASRWDGMYSAGLCSPHAKLATADGQAMLAEAIRTFGGGQPPATAPPAVPSPPPSSPTPTALPAAPVSIIEVIGPVALATFVLGVLVGGVAALRVTRTRKV